MAKKPLILILLLGMFLTTSLASPMVLAAPQGLTAEERSELTGTRKQLATIVFAGLAGAILGLSTLSFYGRPQEHLTNIAIGGALGVITGAVFTTYKAATNPYEAYDLNASNKAIEPDRFAGPFSIAQNIRLVQWQWEF